MILRFFPALLLTLIPLSGRAEPAPATPSPATPAAAAPTMEVKYVEAPAAARLLAGAGAEAPVASKAPVAVLDVRTPEEYAAGHIKGAKNVDSASPDFKANLAKLDRNQAWLVHCGSGGRSSRSLNLLKDLGFRSIIHLDDGFRGWKKAGLPVENPPVSSETSTPAPATNPPAVPSPPQ